MLILNDEFKYILFDTMKVYIGAGYTTEELLKADNIPFKLKAIIMKYIGQEMPKGIMLAEHIANLTEESLPYMTWVQLKLKVKVNFIDDKKQLMMKLPEFLKAIKEYPEEKQYFIEEIILSKLSLMGFSL